MGRTHRAVAAAPSRRLLVLTLVIIVPRLVPGPDGGGGREQNAVVVIVVPGYARPLVGAGPGSLFSSIVMMMASSIARRSKGNEDPTGYRISPSVIKRLARTALVLGKPSKRLSRIRTGVSRQSSCNSLRVICGYLFLTKAFVDGYGESVCVDGFGDVEPSPNQSLVFVNFLLPYDTMGLTPYIGDKPEKLLWQCEL